MDDFVCNEGSKLPASHEPSNYYHPSGLRTIPQAQVGEGRDRPFVLVGIDVPFSVIT